MKISILNSEEAAIEKNFEKYRPVSKEKKNHIEKIIEGSRKSRPISLRMNETDLDRLKVKADKNGLPYQTMINVVIHKYVNDAYLEKEEIKKFLQLKKVG
jgi:predicted DNA binding CopG/RHH family protein